MDLFDRKHEIIEKRLEQMKLNWACYKGGQAYIDKRLMRGVHEDDLSWFGKPEIGVPPRTKRTCYVPYAERVVDKIEEQIWSKPIKRDGAAEAFTLNADRTGQSVDDVLQLLQEYWTVCGWGWLGIDRTGGGKGPKTVAEKERANDSVYWTAYAPWEVVDWHYGENGRLEWALTERGIYDNSDPEKEPFKGFLRTLWRPGYGRRIKMDEGRTVLTDETFDFSCQAVPFVRLGEITKDPHWFDNVESLACKLMNLDSEGHANLSKGVHSLPVVPSEVMERSITEGLGKLAGKEGGVTTDDVKTVVEKVYSRQHPMMEDEASKGITRFVSPPQGDLTAYPNEIERTKKALYEVVGLGLSKQKDTADAESADAKQWDHLDINAVLRERALSIQRLEVRAVKMSLEFDSEFAKYEPVYPTEFNIGSPGDIIAAVKELLDIGVPLPKELLLAVVRAVAEMIPNLNEKERQKIAQKAEKAIDEEENAILRIAKAALAGGKGVGGNAGGGGEGRTGTPPPNADGKNGGAEGGGATDKS